MNNITYTIIDKTNNDDSITAHENDELESSEWQIIDEEIQIKKCKYSNEDLEQKINEDLARTIDYELNYNNKYLTTILDFYEIKRQKLNKKELIKKIVEFETDSSNEKLVQQRHRLFANFTELKNDNFFGKYIMGGL
jgi:hypothetical protein